MSIANGAQLDETVALHDAMWSQRVQIVSDKLHVLWAQEYHSRIQGGTALALKPEGVKVSGGRWRVMDEDGKWQTVNGACTCADYRGEILGQAAAPKGWCKHRCAAMIARDAQALPDEDLISGPETSTEETGEALAPQAAGQDGEALLGGEPVEPAQDPWEQEQGAERAALASEAFAEADHASRMALLTQMVQASVQEALAGRQPALPEAAFSLCLRGRLDGQDAQVTIRGATAHEFRANLQATREALESARSLLDPVAEPSFPAPSQPEPSQAPQTAPSAETADDWCGVHNVTMKRQEKNGDIWWSHKVGEKFCRGKGAK